MLSPEAFVEKGVYDDPDVVPNGFHCLERDQKLTPRIKPIQEHCNRTKIKKGFA